MTKHNCPNCGCKIDNAPAVVGLTPEQLRLLGYIKEFHEQHGFMPTLEEMRDAMNLLAKSGIARMVDGIIARGYLVKKARSARGLGFAA